MRYETRKHAESNKVLLIDHENKTAEEIAIQKHWVYIRLCERAEEIHGIFIPQKSRDEHITLYEVIAIGEEVGKFRKFEKKFKDVPDMDRNSNVQIEVGDTIIIPERACEVGYAEFVRSTTEYEGVIDKGLILAVVK